MKLLKAIWLLLMSPFLMDVKEEEVVEVVPSGATPIVPIEEVTKEVTAKIETPHNIKVGGYYILDWDGRSYVYVKKIEDGIVYCSRCIDLSVSDEYFQQTELTIEEFLEDMCEDKLYYVAYYLDKNGSRSRGRWYASEEDIDEEIERMRKVPHMKYRWVETATIKEMVVYEIAVDEQMSVGKVLGCL